MCYLGLFFVLCLKTGETSGFQMYLLRESMWNKGPLKTVSVSYLFLADSLPGLSTATRKHEVVFELPQAQIHYWRTQQRKNTSTIRITVFGMNCKEIITSLAWCWMKEMPSLSACGAGNICGTLGSRND